MVKGMKALVNELVLEVQGSFENDRRNSIRAFKASGTTIKRKLYAADKKERYFHIYYDGGRKASDREKLEDKIDRMGRKLRELMGDPIRPGGEYKKYFDLVFWHVGLEACHAGGKTADEIVEFIQTAAKKADQERRYRIIVLTG